MSSLIYLVAMAAVGWLVFWTIRDPKQPNWEWWPVEWWPFDTHSEEAAAAEAEKQATAAMGSRPQAIPWRERGKAMRRRARVVRRENRVRPWR
jgi:hypothetical protein